MKNSSATHNSYTSQEELCSLIILVYIFLDLNLFLIIKYLKDRIWNILNIQESITQNRQVLTIC